MEDKIESYKILQHSDIQEIETEINNYIRNGFEPFGSLQVIPCEEGILLIQAVVKRAPIKHKTF